MPTREFQHKHKHKHYSCNIARWVHGQAGDTERSHHSTSNDDWLIDWFIDWLLDWSIDWEIDCHQICIHMSSRFINGMILRRRWCRAVKLEWVIYDKPLWRHCQMEHKRRGYQPPNMSPLAQAIGQRFQFEVLLHKLTTVNTIESINQAWLKIFYFKVIAVNILIHC